jgi:phosphatidylglycerol:prolipoprotein diacylglycerol transferase
MNQEAHGGQVEESFLRNTLHLPSFIVDQMNIKGIFYHPTFLYESVWNLVGFLLLIWLRRRSFVRAGEIFISYFIWYSIGRFFIEGLRTDSLAFNGPPWLASLMNGFWSPMKLVFSAGEMVDGNVRISQLISILIIVAAIIIIYYRRNISPRIALYSDPIVSSKSTRQAGAVDTIREEETVKEELQISAAPAETNGLSKE